MKNSLAIITILIIFISCKKEIETTKNETKASFSIDTLNIFAPSEVSLRNTSTNYNAEYQWEIQKPPFFYTEKYTEEDINFTANYTGTYTAKLIAGNSDTTINFEIKRPKYLFLDNITIAALGSSYAELYYKLVAIQNLTKTDIYTSSKLFNISPTSIAIGNNSWVLPSQYQRIDVVDSDSGDEVYYSLEFYDENDNEVASTNLYSTDFNEDHKFENGDINMKTSISCSGCDQIEVNINSTFSTY